MTALMNMCCKLMTLPDSETHPLVKVEFHNLPPDDLRIRMLLALWVFEIHQAFGLVSRPRANKLCQATQQKVLGEL